MSANALLTCVLRQRQRGSPAVLHTTETTQGRRRLASSAQQRPRSFSPLSHGKALRPPERYPLPSATAHRHTCAPPARALHTTPPRRPPTLLSPLLAATHAEPYIDRGRASSENTSSNTGPTWRTTPPAERWPKRKRVGDGTHVFAELVIVRVLDLRSRARGKRPVSTPCTSRKTSETRRALCESRTC